MRILAISLSVVFVLFAFLTAFDIIVPNKFNSVLHQVTISIFFATMAMQLGNKGE